MAASFTRNAPRVAAPSRLSVGSPFTRNRHAFGTVLAALEVVLGSALLLGAYRRAAAVMSALLGGMFAVANGLALSRGLLIDCGCFGGLLGTTPLLTLFVDVVVVVLGALAARAAK